MEGGGEGAGRQSWTPSSVPTSPNVKQILYFLVMSNRCMKTERTSELKFRSAFSIRKHNESTRKK